MLMWEESTTLGQSREAGLLGSRYSCYEIICRSRGDVAQFDPNKVAHVVMEPFMAAHGAPARAAGLERSRHLASQRGGVKPQRFFGSNKPDMRNAP
jgi:hypothetical protein